MSSDLKVKFLGAAGSVTGSKFYLENEQIRLMIDCGMFQGLKELRLLNWQDLDIDVPKIDLVILTHAHLDHTGYLPKLVKQGFQGKIYGTSPTLAISSIILNDTAKIQEEDAEQANKEEYSKHHPAKPLYTIEDVEECQKLFESVNMDDWIEIGPDVKFRYFRAGHILGACSIELNISGKTLVFSGDLGRRDDLLMEAPKKPRWADYLFLESTYGNRLHPQENVDKILSELILDIIDTRGILLIASFAVERLQLLAYILWKLFKSNHIPEIPVYIDSPMGIDATGVFSRFPEFHKIPQHEFEAMKNRFELVSSYKRTWEIIDMNKPRIVIAGSGMLTGGRILTYLKYYIGNPDTRLLLTGYQAEGTRGRQLEEGAYEIKMKGRYFPVKAKIVKLESLSAHADQKELLDWCSEIKNIPENVFLIHGEKHAADALRVKIETKFNWRVSIPALNDEFSL